MLKRWRWRWRWRRGWSRRKRPKTPAYEEQVVYHRQHHEAIHLPAPSTNRQRNTRPRSGKARSRAEKVGDKVVLRAPILRVNPEARIAECCSSRWASRLSQSDAGRAELRTQCPRIASPVEAAEKRPKGPGPNPSATPGSLLIPMRLDRPRASPGARCHHPAVRHPSAASSLDGLDASSGLFDAHCNLAATPLAPSVSSPPPPRHSRCPTHAFRCAHTQKSQLSTHRPNRTACCTW